MQLKGDNPTLNNIGRNVSSNFRECEERGKESQNFAGTVINIFSAIAKGILFIFAIVSIPLLIAFLIAAAAVLGVICYLPFAGSSAVALKLYAMQYPPFLTLALAFCILIALCIPLFMLVSAMMSSMLAKEISNPRLNKGLWIAWGIVLGAIFIMVLIFYPILS